MKKFLLATSVLVAMCASASAADLPRKAPPPPPPAAPVYNWNGFYIGINGGYSWGRSSRDLTFFNPVTGATLAFASGGGRDINGGVFGGQLGYNWQFSSWLFGIETDAQWTGQKGSTTAFCPVAGCLPALAAVIPGAVTAASISDKLEWFGTIRGRLGFLATPSFLLYVTGGGAYGTVQTDLTLAGFTAAGVPVAVVGSRSTDRFGWTIGGGIESMLWNNWSGKIEYLYVDLGSVSNSVLLPTAAGFPLGANLSTRITDNVIRAGINYHFNWESPSPVVARY
jgi:outer membrane immunogenic protein